MRELLLGLVPVFEDGYRWDNPASISPEDKRYENSLYLIPNRDERRTSDIDREKFIAYDPFRREPALFRIFVDLPLDETAILDFANRHGPLLSAEERGHYSTLRGWKDQITLLKSCVELWEAIRGSDRAVLSQHVTWTRGGQLKWQGPVADRTEATEYLTTPYKRGALLEPASDLLDWALEATCVYDLTLQATRLADGSLVLRFRVYQLLQVLWIQFALAVSEQKEFRRCACCGRPFELSPDVNRRDRKFCSDACRSKTYRRRKARALSMRGEGKTLREIVKQLGSDMKTVKRWLNEEG